MLSVDPSGLQAAADRIRAVAVSACDLDVASPLAAAGEALPGSAVAGACSWATVSLGASIAGWAERVEGLASTAGHVARDLAAADDEVGRTFGGVVP